MPSFKPMLAASCDNIDALRYPLLATPKIDGIRCLIIDGVAMSRSLKPIPNRFIQSVIGKPEFNGLDGELLVGDTFQDATSGIMSEDGQPDFRFYVFDLWDDTFKYGKPPLPYTERIKQLRVKLAILRDSHFMESHFLRPLLPVAVHDRANLDSYASGCLADGHEGIMVRSPDGPYKHGRATFKEGYLTKIKPFEDAEATVIGWEERMHNANEAKTNALGRTERSSHKDNLVPMGTLGALTVSNSTLWPGRTFNIGTGFTDAQRDQLWGQAQRGELAGRIVKFKYQAIGTKDVPRIPVFLGFRDRRDL